MNEGPSKEPKENPREREVSFPAQSWNHFGASVFLSKTVLPKADVPKVTSVMWCFPSAEKWGLRARRGRPSVWTWSPAPLRQLSSGCRRETTVRGRGLDVWSGCPVHSVPWTTSF